MPDRERAGDRVLGIGIVGLGGATLSMLPKFISNPHYRIAGAADIDQEILARFSVDHPKARTHTSVVDLCAQADVDVVYIATPNRLHFEHAQTAILAGKNVLIEKPMTIDMESAKAMVESAERAGVLLGVNVKHSFEPRVLRLRQYARTGQFGELRMLNSWRYANWLYRPRTPEELTPEWGGGILWRQGPHQFDILRTIGGGMVRSVRGTVGVWDPSRRVAGAHTAFLDFQEGTVANAVFSGYDHFDSRELISGLGASRARGYAKARFELRAAQGPGWEAAAAREERYGGMRSGQGDAPAPARGEGSWIIGGPLIASFDHADVCFSAKGLEVFDDQNRFEIDLTSPEDGRDGRLNSLYDSVVHGFPLPADGRWGLATLELLLAVELSSRERAEMRLAHQTPTVDVNSQTDQ
ncbi:MAG: Gfo/Idh/MocA family oxidoreductase [Chloroflexota bacterium]